MEISMKNVFDIKREKNLNFILPKEQFLPGASSVDMTGVLVIMHIHYIETIQEYLYYMSSIPLEANIIFTTSHQEVRNVLESYRNSTGRKFRIMEKINRGRDISALLVTSRNELMKYRLICFAHDKRARDKETQKDVEIFVRCLWENTLGSEAYVRNVIHMFERHTSLGLLMPPESFSDNYKFVHTNTWDNNYKLMEALARELKLHCDLNPKKKPLSLGTVFWARTEALKKLFEKEWKYEDFDEEPLPMDGTISHAVERCFAYVAQDAGFDTGIVMTDKFAGERMDAMQDIMTETFDFLTNVIGIQTIGELKVGNQAYASMLEFAKKFRYVYIYGAGEYGRICRRILNGFRIPVESYIVSNREEMVMEAEGLAIYNFSEIPLDDETGIIIAVSSKYSGEIMEEIRKEDANFKNIYYFSCSDLSEEGRTL